MNNKNRRCHFVNLSKKIPFTYLSYTYTNRLCTLFTSTNAPAPLTASGVPLLTPPAPAQRGTGQSASEMGRRTRQVRTVAQRKLPAYLPRGRLREVRQVLPQQRVAVSGDRSLQGEVHVRQVRFHTSVMYK